jgi:hypothetical protein
MLFIHGLDTVDAVSKIRANAMCILADELAIMEQTVEGNNFRLQFAMPIKDLINECNSFLKTELLGQPRPSRTSPFIIR